MVGLRGPAPAGRVVHVLQPGDPGGWAVVARGGGAVGLALLDLPPAGRATHDGRRGGADVTAWRARLAVLRSEHADANRAESADSPDGSPLGANGAFGIRVAAPRQAAKAGVLNRSRRVRRRRRHLRELPGWASVLRAAAT